MAGSIAALKDRARSPGGKKAIKYTLVSVVAVFVSQVALAIIYGGFHWTAKSANLAAASIGAVPSYYLNRYWAWGKRGRSHFLKEVTPFWIAKFMIFNKVLFKTHPEELEDNPALDGRTGIPT